MTLDNVTKKSMGNISFLGARGQEILSRQHFFKDKQFHLDLWACDLKIKMVIYSLWAFTLLRFGNCQAKTSKDIEKRLYTAPSLAIFKKNGQRYWVDIAWSAEGQTNRSTGAKEYALFSKGNIKYEFLKNLHSKCWCIKLKIFFQTTWKKIMPPLKKGAYCFAPIGRSVALQIKQCPLNISRPPISLDHTLSRSRWRSNWYSLFYDPLFGGYQTCYTGGL